MGIRISTSYASRLMRQLQFLYRNIGKIMKSAWLAATVFLVGACFPSVSYSSEKTVLSASTAHPEWRPDGSRLLVAHAEPGALEKIVEIGLDGAVLSQFNFSNWRETYPAYSPNQNAFAFITLIRDGEKAPRFTISVYDFRSETSKVIVNNGSTYEPRFSPDGSKLAYTVARDDGRGIAILDLVTMKESWLYKNNSAGFPSWSPDGETVIFNQKNSRGFFEIAELSLRTGNIKPVVKSSGNSYYGHYAPNGNAIVYMSDKTNPGERNAREIYVKSISDNSTRRLTNNQHRDGYPKWSPDGTKIAWHSGQTDAFKIAIMELASGETRYVSPRISDPK